MTVTRNQGEIQDNALTHRPQEPLAMSQQSSQPSPNWLGLVLQIAQDKRHDIAAPTLRFWKEKLKGFADGLICQALSEGRWEFFPDVDKVISQIEAIQERKRQENDNAQWEAYKLRQQAALREGRMASDEDYAYMRSKLREIFGDPTAKQTGKKA